jgi:hypothetical protein
MTKLGASTGVYSYRVTMEMGHQSEKVVRVHSHERVVAITVSRQIGLWLAVLIVQDGAAGIATR